MSYLLVGWVCLSVGFALGWCARYRRFDEKEGTP